MKKFKKSFLVTLVIVMVMLSNVLSVLAYTAPNLSSTAYTTGNVFYNSGYSGQCTWFAWGRTKEVLGISLNSQFYGNAVTWWNQNTYPSGQTATSNCIAVFGGTYGHVVYVEYVVGDTIYFNEANFHVPLAYDGALESQTTTNFKNRSGVGNFLGFIYLQSTPPTTSVTVDDGGTGFYKYGPSEYWHYQSIGYNGDMMWTYGNGSVVSNYCQWKPTLPSAGSYKVEVYIPNNYATATNAKYTIKANGGTYTATVNQNIYYNQWVTLGTYYFNGSNNGTEYVQLTDATGEYSSMVGFDAVRFTK